MRLIRNYVLALLLLALLGLSNVTQTHANVQPLLVASDVQNLLPENSQAIDFNLTSIKTKKTLNLSVFEGKLLLLDLFATWCTPCIMAVNDLRPIYNDYTANTRLAALSIDVDSSETANDVREFAKTYKMPWDYALDSSAAINGSKSVSSVYGTGYIPTMYLIWNNIIVYSEIGYAGTDVIVPIIEQYIGTPADVPSTNTTTNTTTTTTPEKSTPLNFISVFAVFAVLPVIIRKKRV